MRMDSRKAVGEEDIVWGPDTIEAEIRERIRAMIEAILEEELDSTLGAGRSQRVGTLRIGYRHGARERQLTTSLGKTMLMLPRARLKGADGAEIEWHSRIIPRYQRRTERVDAALLGTYLSGINSRRLRGALSPLLRGAPLSKDAVSRLVGRLRDEFTAWSARDLAAEQVCYLFMDGWYPRVRIGKKRARVPVLVTLGVCVDGRRVVLDMRIAGQESETAWRELVQSLVKRHLGTPALAVIDGNPGLHLALRAQWPEIAIQRCTNHKLRNLLAKAPAHLREEVAEDYRRMMYAETREAVEQARANFLRKWRLRCKGVVSSLEEAGDELFTFLKFPRLQWKALRTTNALERINEEFRRRTKTQASLPGEDAVLLLLYGLLRSGQIVLRRIDGRNDMPKPSSQLRAAEDELGFSSREAGAMDTQITIKRLTGSIGAEIKGVDLKHPLDDSAFATIHQAFLDHCMLVFRGQFLDPTAQMTFALRWGEILDAPYLRPIEMPDHPGMLLLPNLGKERSYTTEVWHTDLSFMPAPPAMTMLAAQVLPEAGGDTMFASQYRAYETLSEGMKHILEGLRGVHGGGMLAGLFGIADTATRQSHPIVRTHPDSGRKALYVNSLYTQSIEGLTDAESRGLLDFLFQHVCRPDFTYRHQWALGDVVMWDNRCALHYAVHDHGEAPRVMHRTVVAGDIPR